ncbi:glycosyltransferase family 2 protein [Halorubrum kocurii]|uniref:Glycosyl transferase n=1 Tax=Halorubrum kocurii JCM 14978 TaxID=1230456 RepID=M0PKB2_9EURY|nr:glycosyltransferase family 2 protein [Halorubrum kocurii]EMA70388.1 glycosyl transferase [Halorubrum kocurii JCM 14978]
MSNHNPLVSVVIPTHNRKDLLADAIDSVVNQTYDNIEIIIIDDDSDYNIENCLREHPQNIKLISNNSNQGANWSRIRGILSSEGDYLAFLDDDDLWDNTKIEKQIKAITHSESSVGVVTVGYRTKSGETIIPKQTSGKQLMKSFLLSENSIGGFSMILVKRSAIKDAGLPDIRLSSSQDLEWYIRLAKVCDFYIISEPLVTYNDDNDIERISNRSWEEQHDSQGEILNKHEYILNNFGIRFKRKAHSKRYITLSKYAAISGEYSNCRKHAILAAKKYPISMTPPIMYVLSFFADGITSIYSKIPSRVQEHLPNII